MSESDNLLLAFPWMTESEAEDYLDRQVALLAKGLDITEEQARARYLRALTNPTSEPLRVTGWLP